MASIESIGSCSLDGDATTASESSGTADGRLSSVSQHTLHSSVNYELSHEAAFRPSPLILKEEQEARSHFYVSKGSRKEPCDNDKLSPDANFPSRQPSYVSISCSVSGYTSFSCYSSKAREGLRSRDNSPGRTTFTGSSLSDFICDQQQQKGAAVPVGEGKSSMYLTVGPTTYRDGKYHLNNSITANVRQAVSSGEVCVNSDVNLHSRMNGTKTEHVSDYNHSVEYQNQIDASDTYFGSTKSLVQQRIERLYGPGALAQGFLVHRARPRTPTPSSSRPPVFNQSNPSSQSVNGETEVDFSPSHFKFSLKTVGQKGKNVSDDAENETNHKQQKFDEHSHNDCHRMSAGIISLSKNDVPYTNGHGSEKLENGNKITNGAESSDNGLAIGHEDSSTDKCKINSQTYQDGSKKDGYYFIKLMDIEELQIRQLIKQGESRLDEGHMSEELAGRFRAAIGKANLLIAQKFQQFRGLCEKNINRLEGDPFPTTSSDLEGFWDMIRIQVYHIYDLFREINLLQEDKWNQLKATTEVDGGTVSRPKAASSVNGSKTKKIVAKKISATPARSMKAEAAAKAREEARKHLAELKRKARSQLITDPKHEEQHIEIYTPENKDAL